MTELEKKGIALIGDLPYAWNKLKGKSILISGGTGFIGTFLIDVLRYRNARYHDGIKVVSLSRRGGASDDTVQYLKADITNPITCDEGVDFVLHLASNTHPKQYAEDPVGTIITNIIGCDNLLKIAVEKKARFLLASSVEIYGQGIDAPVSEQYSGYIDCNQARAGYNEAKRTCEALCQSYRSQYGVDAVIVRLARIFGADKKQDTKAMSQFMKRALMGEDIVLKSLGNQRFSYCYVADAVSGILKVLMDGADGEAYNISGFDAGMTLRDYAEYIAGLADKRVIMEIEENQSVSKASYALLDIEKIIGLGWKPLYSVQEGLQLTYQIYREREALY